MSHLLAAHLFFAAPKPAAKSTSSSYLLIIVGLFALFYFFIIRPRSQRQRSSREQVRAAQVGDEIATIGGLVGTIVSEEGDRVTLSTGTGTELVFLRRAIGQKLTPPEAPTTATDEEAAQFEGQPPGFGATSDEATPAETDETHKKGTDGS